MKKIVLFFAFVFIFFDSAYSMSLSSTSSNTIFLPDSTTSFALKVNPNIVWNMTAITKDEVSKKSEVIVTEKNASTVVQSFIDILSEALWESGTTTEDTLRDAVLAFENTLKTQKNIIGNTAKNVFEVFEEQAKKVINSDKLAKIIDEKIRNTKFISDINGKVEEVRRSPKEVCFGILFCIFKKTGQEAYNYLQKQK